MRRAATGPERDGNTEQQILDGAHTVFLRHGTSGARMQDIAAEAGVNQALLHYYFRSKERLSEAVFRRAAAQLLPRVIGVMGFVSAGFLLFMLLTSNPFARHVPALDEPLELRFALQIFEPAQDQVQRRRDAHRQVHHEVAADRLPDGDAKLRNFERANAGSSRILSAAC